MDEARLALELLDRYDALHWDIVALRTFSERPKSKRIWAEGSEIDRARFRLSQFFAHLKVLVSGGFVTQEFVDKVVSKDAKNFCGDLINTMNATIRSRNHKSPTKADVFKRKAAA